ncbi:MAG: hypothetical protein HC888_03235 [Candidatus Competibacteraceae bacterium]|nr:hypothetical protein [Candidatus Competibacteraceae bacterium]
MKLPDYRRASSIESLPDDWGFDGLPPASAEASLATIMDSEYNTDEDDVVAEIVRLSILPSTEITVPGIAEMSPEDVLKQLRVLASSATMLGRAAVKLYKPLGEILIHIQNSPSVWHRAGFDSFTAFCDKYLTEDLGISKGTRARAITIARDFPTLSAQQVADVGVVNLMDLKSAYGGEKDPAAKEQLDRLVANPTPEVKKEFRERITTLGIDSGRTMVQIWTTPVGAEQWREFLTMPEVQAYVNNEGPGKILEAMIAECKVEWVQRGRDMMEARDYDSEER